MNRIKRFEDIASWKSARKLTTEIYQVTSSNGFARDFGLRDQIRKASVSILSNIAEGYERGNDKESCYFLAIAKGSSGEVRAQLYVALDQGYIPLESFNRLSKAVTEIGEPPGGFHKISKPINYAGK
jgi:four helix bundle protein